LPAKEYDTAEMSGSENIAIRVLYNTLPGRIALKALVRPLVSKFFGFLMDSWPSSFFINCFVKRNNIDMSEYEEVKYRSFNDFFARKVKDGLRPFPSGTNDLAAPCDAKLTAYPITADAVFRIKNSIYDVNALLQDKPLADEYAGGVCLIFRLTPDDYHRYSYIDDSEIVAYKKIKGVLHTVRPISHKYYNIYRQNSREYAVIQTKNFGKVIQMEVGALFVGRITNHAASGTFGRGEEKGMFEFGGSTIVMLFQKDKVTIDGAIYENTRQNRETIVKMGYKIGKKT
jgi:phosphatidylserine decarboxylase